MYNIKNIDDFILDKANKIALDVHRYGGTMAGAWEEDLRNEWDGLYSAKTIDGFIDKILHRAYIIEEFLMDSDLFDDDQFEQ